MAKNLSDKILKKLTEKTGKSENAIQVALTRILHKNPTATRNAAAQLYADKHGFTVWGMLDAEDKGTLPATTQQAPATRSTKRTDTKSRPRPIIEVIKHETTNSFCKKHIQEANQAYTAGCYTAALILTRKIFENLCVELLLGQFPENSTANKDLYYDIARKRFKDFSIIEDNLYKKRHDFPASVVKPIERLHDKLKPFMKIANDHTHSWYHICTKTEFDHLEVQEISDLIEKINSALKK